MPITEAWQSVAGLFHTRLYGQKVLSFSYIDSQRKCRLGYQSLRHSSQKRGLPVSSRSPFVTNQYHCRGVRPKFVELQRRTCHEIQFLLSMLSNDRIHSTRVKDLPLESAHPAEFSS